jgi:hypothetical protein
MPHRILLLNRVVSAIGLAIWLILAAMFLGSCVTTPEGTRRPPTPTELAAMDEPTWQAYLGRVEFIATMCGGIAVEHGMDADKVLEVAQALTAIEDPARVDLYSVAVRAGVSPTLAAILTVEAQALLDARGGLPGGPRGIEFLLRAANAFVSGAASADMARGARS